MVYSKAIMGGYRIYTVRIGSTGDAIGSNGRYNVDSVNFHEPYRSRLRNSLWDSHTSIDRYATADNIMNLSTAERPGDG